MVMTFGDISLDPETGIFEAQAPTADQLSALLIDEMNNIYSAPIPVLEASLEMQPSYKTKPDPVAFENNKALLQDGLECQVRARFNRRGNERGIYSSMWLNCGIFEEDGSPL
jgi:hypothetical protein